MKECHWCKKSCPDNEEGGFETDPKDENINVGWVCDHCILAFDGKCDCKECTENEKAAQKELERYYLAHPRYRPRKRWSARLKLFFSK